MIGDPENFPRMNGYGWTERLPQKCSHCYCLDVQPDSFNGLKTPHKKCCMCGHQYAVNKWRVG